MKIIYFPLVSLTWKYHMATPEIRPVRDFTKLNKMALTNKLHRSEVSIKIDHSNSKSTVKLTMLVSRCTKEQTRWIWNCLMIIFVTGNPIRIFKSKIIIEPPPQWSIWWVICLEMKPTTLWRQNIRGLPQPRFYIIWIIIDLQWILNPESI